MKNFTQNKYTLFNCLFFNMNLIIKFEKLL